MAKALVVDLIAMSLVREPKEVVSVAPPPLPYYGWGWERKALLLGCQWVFTLK